MHLALEIVKAEDTPDQELLKKLEWIKENTTDRLCTNYFLMVHIIIRNMSKSLDYDIDIKNSPKRSSKFTLGEVISEMEQAHISINDIVREIAKKYSLDISFNQTGQIVLPEIPMEKT